MNYSNEIFKATLQGGSTYSLNDGECTQDLFMVSSNHDLELIVNVDNFSITTITDYINSNKEILEHDNLFIGTWLNDNKVYLDISTGLSHSVALTLAGKLGEKAIFGIKEGIEIFL